MWFWIPVIWWKVRQWFPHIVGLSELLEMSVGSQRSCCPLHPLIIYQLLTTEIKQKKFRTKFMLNFTLYLLNKLRCLNFFPCSAIFDILYWFWQGLEYLSSSFLVSYNFLGNLSGYYFFFVKNYFGLSLGHVKYVVFLHVWSSLLAERAHAHWTLHTEHCILNTAHWTLHSRQCTAHWRLHSKQLKVQRWGHERGSHQFWGGSTIS